MRPDHAQLSAMKDQLQEQIRQALTGYIGQAKTPQQMASIRSQIKGVVQSFLAANSCVPAMLDINTTVEADPSDPTMVNIRVEPTGMLAPHFMAAQPPVRPRGTPISGFVPPAEVQTPAEPQVSGGWDGDPLYSLVRDDDD